MIKCFNSHKSFLLVVRVAIQKFTSLIEIYTYITVIKTDINVMKGATSFGEILFLIVPFKPRRGGGRGGGH